CARPLGLDEPPAHLLQCAPTARAMAARSVRGCWGTPAGDAAPIAAAVREVRAPRSSLAHHERRDGAAAPPDVEETHFARLLREGKWVVSAQLEPPFGGSLAGLLDVVAALEDSGLVDVVDVNDNSGARAAMNALMVS